jgi:hypothetical protein
MGRWGDAIPLNHKESTKCNDETENLENISSSFCGLGIGRVETACAAFFNGSQIHRFMIWFCFVDCAQPLLSSGCCHAFFQ